ncbi:transferrin-binding protein-like solute binding protein [Paralysiella testudinis]|uniref:Transferrin-binding protein-like solute binding protein n=1 Tax=Paralysiella testudinis TaxID=2809020 RepID=A0A892ZCT0_9NEIS|nr:transferrin-binding protein-like solute binding protein [Paralysiella testudinis]
MSYARYGVVKVDGNPIVFAQGNLSTDTPTTGKATYEGLSVHVAGSAAPITGDSRFDVDFGAKKLIGVVGVAGGGIELSADITGNTFSGTHQISGVQTQGAFYGPQAAELSGTYSNKAANYNGAFGAVKQP